jgi:proline utilization trans-activator
MQERYVGIKLSMVGHCRIINVRYRRLAAATGNPPGIQDDAVRASYPDTAPGFASPVALNLNIRIARTTGEVLQG